MSTQLNDYSCIEYIDSSSDNKKKCEIRPSDEQLSIITSALNTDQKIIACAGSGKTTTLVIRLKYLIDQGVPPETILVSTYNVDAGKNLKQRARQIIGQQSNMMEIGNIDKIAFKFYKNFIMQNCKKASSYKLSVKEYCYQLYLYLLTSEGEQNIIRKYKYFFFDEFQDVNDLQYDILMLFKKQGCNLVVIGDDAQNIYSWRNSRLEIIQSQIDEDIQNMTGKQIKTFNLSTNYRCSKQITCFSNQIIQNSKYLFQKCMKYIENHPHRKNNSLPNLKVYDGLSQQIQGIIKKIKQLKNKCSLNEIAVLSPTNQPLRFFEEWLEKNNQKQYDVIPYISRSSNQSDFYTKQIKDKSKQQKLTLSTLHCAKGLEWKIVFFIGINDTFFPGDFFREGPNLTKLEECRRLFYVGCTRAAQELHFSVTRQKKNQNQNIPIVCRFFNEIDKNLYIRDDNLTEKDFAKMQIDQSFKSQELQTKVVKIIEQFDHLDHTEAGKYFEGFNFLDKEQVHKKIELNHEEIEENSLYPDLGLYMNIFIQRSVAQYSKDQNGYSYSHAQQVLFSIHWTTQRAHLVQKYKLFFYDKNVSMEKIKNGDEMIAALIEKYRCQNIDIELNQSELTLLKDIFDTIKQFMLKNGLEYRLVSHLIMEGKKDRMIEYFPEDFDSYQYIESYKRFCNLNLDTYDILNDIYNVSKCGQLVNLIRKSLYRDDFKILHSKDQIAKNQDFINHLKAMGFKKIQVKKVVSDNHLEGEIDFMADDTLFQVKISQNDQISKEYILQALAYAALLRKEGVQQVNSIAFYYPIQGTLLIHDISSWKYEQEYSQFLFEKVKQKAEARIKQNLNEILSFEIEEKELLDDVNQLEEVDEFLEQLQNEVYYLSEEEEEIGDKKDKQYEGEVKKKEIGEQIRFEQIQDTINMEDSFNEDIEQYDVKQILQVFQDNGCQNITKMEQEQVDQSQYDNNMDGILYSENQQAERQNNIQSENKQQMNEECLGEQEYTNENQPQDNQRKQNKSILMQLDELIDEEEEEDSNSESDIEFLKEIAQNYNSQNRDKYLKDILLSQECDQDQYMIQPIRNTISTSILDINQGMSQTIQFNQQQYQMSQQNNFINIQIPEINFSQIHNLHSNHIEQEQQEQDEDNISNSETLEIQSQDQQYPINYTQSSLSQENLILDQLENQDLQQNQQSSNKQSNNNDEIEQNEHYSAQQQQKNINNIEDFNIQDNSTIKKWNNNIRQTNLISPQSVEQDQINEKNVENVEVTQFNEEINMENHILSYEVQINDKCDINFQHTQPIQEPNIISSYFNIDLVNNRIHSQAHFQTSKLQNQKEQQKQEEEKQDLNIIEQNGILKEQNQRQGNEINCEQNVNNFGDLNDKCIFIDSQHSIIQVQDQYDQSDIQNQFVLLPENSLVSKENDINEYGIIHQKQNNNEDIIIVDLSDYESNDDNYQLAQEEQKQSLYQINQLKNKNQRDEFIIQQNYNNQILTQDYDNNKQIHQIVINDSQSQSLHQYYQQNDTIINDIIQKQTEQNTTFNLDSQGDIDNNQMKQSLPKIFINDCHIKSPLENALIEINDSQENEFSFLNTIKPNTNRNSQTNRNDLLCKTNIQNKNNCQQTNFNDKQDQTYLDAILVMPTRNNLDIDQIVTQRNLDNDDNEILELATSNDLDSQPNQMITKQLKLSIMQNTNLNTDLLSLNGKRKFNIAIKSQNDDDDDICNLEPAPVKKLQLATTVESQPQPLWVQFIQLFGYILLIFFIFHNPQKKIRFN